MYAITATTRRQFNQGKGDAWTYSIETRQVPTFYLDENVQGIVDEGHARLIASDIVDPYHDCFAVNITAIKIDAPPKENS